MLVGQRSPKVYTSEQNEEPKPLPAPNTAKEVDNRLYQARMIRVEGKAQADEIRRQGFTEANEIRRQGFDEAAQHGQKAQEGLKKAESGQRKMDEGQRKMDEGQRKMDGGQRKMDGGQKKAEEADKDLNRMEAIRAKALAEKQRRQQLAGNEAPQSQSSQRRGT
jgi:hypothetical protein